MNHTHQAPLLLLSLLAAAGAVACAGDTVYLPAEGDIHAASQGVKGAVDADAGVDANADSGEPPNATSMATVGDASAATTYCRVIERGADASALRFACDLETAPAPMVIEACPCTDAYGCPANVADPANDAGTGNAVDGRFLRTTLTHTCQLLGKTDAGFVLQCDAHALAVSGCASADAGCEDVPMAAHDALARGVVPDGICSMAHGTSDVEIDADGFFQRIVPETFSPF